MPDQVHDAGLHHGLGEHRSDRFREAFEAVDDNDEHVLDPAMLEFVHQLAPSICPIRRRRISSLPSTWMPRAVYMA